MRIKIITSKGLVILKFNYTVKFENLKQINSTLFDIYVEQKIEDIWKRLDLISWEATEFHKKPNNLEIKI